MSKITGLTEITEFSGTEQVVLTKSGATRRGAIGGLVGQVAAPLLAQAEQAADTALAAALASYGQMVFGSTAAGIVGTTIGGFFFTAGTTADDFLRLWKHEAGHVATLVSAIPSSARASVLFAAMEQAVAASAGKADRIDVAALSILKFIDRTKWASIIDGSYSGDLNDEFDTAIASGEKRFTLGDGTFPLDLDGWSWLIDAADIELIGNGPGRTSIVNRKLTGVPARPLMISRGANFKASGIHFQPRTQGLDQVTMGNGQVALGCGVLLMAPNFRVENCEGSDSWDSMFGVAQIDLATGQQTDGNPYDGILRGLTTRRAGRGVQTVYPPDMAGSEPFQAGSGVNVLCGGRIKVDSCIDYFSSQGFIVDYAGGANAILSSLFSYGARKSTVGSYPSLDATPGGQGYYIGARCDATNIWALDSEGDGLWLDAPAHDCAITGFRSKGGFQRGVIVQGYNNRVQGVVEDCSRRGNDLYDAVVLRGGRYLGSGLYTDSTDILIDIATRGTQHRDGVNIEQGTYKVAGMASGNWQGRRRAVTALDSDRVLVVGKSATDGAAQTAIGKATVTSKNKSWMVEPFGDYQANGTHFVQDFDNPAKRIASGIDPVNNVGVLQAMLAGVSTLPFMINPSGGMIGLGKADYLNPIKEGGNYRWWTAGVQYHNTSLPVHGTDGSAILGGGGSVYSVGLDLTDLGFAVDGTPVVAGGNVKAGAGQLMLAKGGTGATTAAAARGNLDAMQDQTALASAQSVLTANATPVGTDYWGLMTRGTRFKPGSYAVAASITFDGPQGLTGDHAHGTSFGLSNGVNASLLTVNPSPLSDPLPYADISHANISGLMLNGNGGNQSGTSHGLNFPDAGWTRATRYGVAAHVSRVTINSAHTNAIYLGVNRNWAMMSDVLARYSTGDNLVSYGYDHVFSGMAFANAGANGVNLVAGGGTFFSNSSTFYNAGVGLVIGPFVNQTNAWNAGAFDANGTRGAYIDAGSQPQVTHAILSARFSGNSRLSGGTYSDIYVQNAPTPIVIGGNMFVYNGITKSKYLVELAADTDFAHFFGNSWSSAAAPYTLGISNRYYNLILAGTDLARLTFASATGDSLAMYMGASKTFDWTSTKAESYLPFSISSAAGEAQLSLNSLAGQASSIYFRSGGVVRWKMLKGNAETGSDAGGDLIVNSYTDAGGYKATPLSILRQTGRVVTSYALQAAQLDIAGSNTVIDANRLIFARSYTVGTLPTAGAAGRTAYASNARVFNGAGTQEGAGAGTGSLVNDNGTAWKLPGTNVTAAA